MVEKLKAALKGRLLRSSTVARSACERRRALQLLQAIYTHSVSSGSSERTATCSNKPLLQQDKEGINGRAHDHNEKGTLP